MTSIDERPVLLVTNHAPPHRVEPFRRLAAAEGVHVVLIGGTARHGGGGTRGGDALGFDHSTPGERAIFGLAASGRFRAVVAALAGRVALPAAYAGARRAGVPFVLWATLWAHPRTAAHALSYLPLRHIYRDADAIVTYGPHVSAYLRAKGARAPIFEAAQAVDNAFWSAPGDPAASRHADAQFLFAGRLVEEKGVTVLLDAWRAGDAGSALVLAGDGPLRGAARGAGAVVPGPQTPEQLRNFYAASDVVVLPSLPTRDFREPWGLIVNEAFNQGLPVIASDAVGAAQPPGAGLLRDERNGLVVPAGDVRALAEAMGRLRRDGALRARLGAAGRADVAAYDVDAWVDGMRRGLAAVGSSRGEPSQPRRSLR